MRRGAISGMAMMAAAAALLSTPDHTSSFVRKVPNVKKRRQRKEADRSKKQYKLKGIRP